jgi:hypothetical protein
MGSQSEPKSLNAPAACDMNEIQNPKRESDLEENQEKALPLDGSGLGEGEYEDFETRTYKETLWNGLGLSASV